MIKTCLLYLCCTAFMAAGICSLEAQSSVPLASAKAEMPIGSIREEICLNGDWDFQIDGSAESVKVRVPGSYTGLRKAGGQQYYDIWDYPLQWEGKGGMYSRMFELPAAMLGKRVSFWCGGVRHSCTVKVNDVDVGGYEGSTAPFELDITKALKSGVNTIKVHVNPGALDFEDVNAARRGFWHDVYLKAHGEVRITDDSFLTTSLAKKELQYQVAVVNEGDASRCFSIHCFVVDKGGAVVKSFEGGSHSVDPGSTGIFDVSTGWENPHLWSLDDPYLYHLKTVLYDEAGKPIDTKDQRFGFREITWKGPLMFLNAKPLYLRGAGDHTEGDLSCDAEYMRVLIRELKKEGVCFMRLHTMVKSAATFDVADEEGFLLEAEAPHHFKLPSVERSSFNVEHLVKAYRNHPSVFIWSVANELHWKGDPEPGYLIELCHQLDPSRPAFASDFSGWSVLGDVVGHHYNTVQVFEEWEKFGPNKPMIWDEFGWVWPWDRPVSSGPAGYEYASQDPSGADLWHDAAEEIRMGIDFFQNGKTFANELHRVTMWSPWDYSQNFHRYQPFNNFQNLQLKHAKIEGVPGIKPVVIKPGSSFVNVWDPTLPAWESNPGYDVIAPYLKSVRFTDLEPREVTFFGGNELVRHCNLWYDDLRSCDAISCRVETLDGKLLSEEKVALSIQPGERRENVVLHWKLPEVQTVTPVRIVRQFCFQDQAGYRDVAEVKIFPKLTPSLLPKLLEKNLAVSDASLSRWMQQQGFTLVDPAQADVWITTEETQAVQDFVKRGGCVLQLVTPAKVGNVGTLHNEVRITAAYLPLHAAIDAKGALSVGEDLIWRGSSSLPKKKAPFSVERSSGGSFIQYHSPGNTGSCIYVDLYKEGKKARLIGVGRLVMEAKVGVHFKADDNGEQRDVGRKELLPILRTHHGEWFIASAKDAIVMEQTKSTDNGVMISKDLRAVVWHHIRKASPVLSRPIEEDTVPVVPDFSAVTAFGFCVAKEASENATMKFYSLKASGDMPAAAHIPLNGAPHRLLTGLGQEDFTFWRDGSSLDMIPITAGKKNLRVVLQGNKNGNGATLAEFPTGTGNRVVCALNLVNKLEKEPAAQWVLRNTLEYLAQYQPSSAPMKTALAVGEKWGTQLRAVGLIADTLPESGVWSFNDVGQVILDAGSPAILEGCRRNKEALRQFIWDGGTVLVLGMNPTGIEIFRSLTDCKLRLTEPFLGVRDICVKAPVSWTRRSTPSIKLEVYDGILTHQAFEANYDPLIAGLANDDMNWRGKPMFQSGIEVEGMDPVMASPDYSILISNWRVSLEQPANGLFREYIHAVHDMRQNSWYVNRDPVLLRVNKGKGAWVFCQLELASGDERGQRVLTELLTNLHCSLGESTRFAADNATFDEEPYRDQLQRFSKMAGQVAPGLRKYYGTPKPLPDYLQDTFADSTHAAPEAPPSMCLLGDEVMLQYAPGIRVQFDGKYGVENHPKSLGNTREVIASLEDILAARHWNTVLLSAGLEDLRLVNGKPTVTIEEFTANLDKILIRLKKAAGKIYYASIILPPEVDTAYARALVATYNEAAEQACRNNDVYYVNVNVMIDQVAPDYSKRSDPKLSKSELEELAKHIASALAFLG